jgi:hypothetical protein
MIIWVKDLVTGNKWILDHDNNKPVYEDGEKLMFSLEQISNYRFYPCDPDEDNEKQFTIFDYLEE